MEKVGKTVEICLMILKQNELIYKEHCVILFS